MQAQDTPDPISVGGTFNTADGTRALFSVTTGAANSAFGWRSLFSDTDASFNTAVGALSLLSNNEANNTAVGAAALLLNAAGDSNTAVGAAALEKDTAGPFNTAVGFEALMNATANANAAVGDLALINPVRASSTPLLVRQPTPIKRRGIIMSTTAREVSVSPARATPVTYRASLARRLIPPPAL